MIVYPKTPYNHYWEGELHLKIKMESTLPVCSNCKFLKGRYDTTYCLLTEEPILKPSKARGEYCPIEWKIEEGTK